MGAFRRWYVVWYIEDKDAPLGNRKAWSYFNTRKEGMIFRDTKKAESDCIHAHLYGDYPK